MAGATHRSYKAGKDMAKAIIEMVHLMYQNNTAAHFYQGLNELIQKEMRDRKLLNGKKSKKEDPKRQDQRREKAQPGTQRHDSLPCLYRNGMGWKNVPKLWI